MPVKPKIATPTDLGLRTCANCGASLPTRSFAFTRSIFYPDGRLTICNECITKYLQSQEFSWDAIDRVCRLADLPFIVREWQRLYDLNGPLTTWSIYSQIFQDQCYEGFGWQDYNNQYKALREAGAIEDEIPLVREAHWQQLREKWGANYDEEELTYLEDLYKGLLATQSVSGALQIDQAKKICALSLEINSRIRAGDKEVDKFLASYDKLVKTAEFTPKNVKNVADFDSFAEVGYWLEKRGRMNKFYDGETRDVVDETLKNIESYNQRVYINEGGIGDEITERLNALKSVTKLEESTYGITKDFDEDSYSNDAYAGLEENNEFEVGDE